MLFSGKVGNLELGREECAEGRTMHVSIAHLLPGDVQLRRRAVIRSRVVQDPGASGEGHLHDVFEHALASHSGDRVHLCRRRRGKLVRPQHLVVMLFS